MRVSSIEVTMENGKTIIVPNPMDATFTPEQAGDIESTYGIDDIVYSLLNVVDALENARDEMKVNNGIEANK